MKWLSCHVLDSPRSSERRDPAIPDVHLAAGSARHGGAPTCLCTHHDQPSPPGDQHLPNSRSTGADVPGGDRYRRLSVDPDVGHGIPEELSPERARFDHVVPNPPGHRSPALTEFVTLLHVASPRCPSPSPTRPCGACAPQPTAERTAPRRCRKEHLPHMSQQPHTPFTTRWCQGEVHLPPCGPVPIGPGSRRRRCALRGRDPRADDEGSGRPHP